MVGHPSSLQAAYVLLRTLVMPLLWSNGYSMPVAVELSARLRVNSIFTRAMEATEATVAKMTHKYHINERMTKDANVAACDYQTVQWHASTRSCVIYVGRILTAEFYPS